MRNTNKKGFTIVELVIVVAVIAILAAVLIPTFSGIIKKAQLSADQSAVNQMNEVLAIAEVDTTIAVIADAKASLAKNGIDAENYKPLSNGYEFYWVEGLNRIILVSAENAIYPKNLEANAQGKTWWSLSGEGNVEAVDSITTNLNTGSVVLSGTTDMKGASINLMPTANATIGGASASAPAVLENVVSDEGSKVNATGDFVNNKYYAGFISTVAAGTTVTVENLVIDGAVIGDTTQPNSAQAGIIAGSVSGVLHVKNVTIKNSVVFGQYKIGALVGAVSGNGKVIIENVTFENVVVKGRWMTGKIAGVVASGATVEYRTDVDTSGIKVEASEFNGATNLTLETINGNQYDIVDTTGYPYLTDKDYWKVISNEEKLTSSKYPDVKFWNYVGQSND